MQIKFESRHDKLKRISDWHFWFAWYPIKLHDRIIWLEKVQRKYNGFYDVWSYMPVVERQKP